jgi:hypothetical protein
MPQENNLVPGDRIPGKNNMNGRVRTVFDDGNYSFYLFFIVESEYVDSIKEVFD